MNNFFSDLVKFPNSSYAAQLFECESHIHECEGLLRKRTRLFLCTLIAIFISFVHLEYDFEMDMRWPDGFSGSFVLSSSINMELQNIDV